VLNSAAMLDTTLRFISIRRRSTARARRWSFCRNDRGNFFNQQHRHLGVPVGETLPVSTRPGGLHSYKIGVDVLGTGYDGTSASGRS
jgi:hypothetical protein